MLKCHRIASPWLIFFAFVLLSGCGSSDLPTAPVEGKVLCDGKPLEFGGVLFQADSGPPGLGSIQPDGTFRLSTYRDGDGAVLGTHRVQISCYDAQHPDADAIRGRETGVGKSLIPQKYTRYDTSELAVEVKAHNEPVLLQLRTK